VIVGAETGGRWLGGTQRTLGAAALSPFVGQSLRPMLAAERGADLDLLRSFLQEGKLKPVIDRTYPLSKAADAVRYLGEGHAHGKIVLTV